MASGPLAREQRCFLCLDIWGSHVKMAETFMGFLENFRGGIPLEFRNKWKRISGIPEFGTSRNFGVHTGSVQGLQVVQRMSMFPARRRAPALSCVFFMTASHHSAIAWGLHELMI